MWHRIHFLDLQQLDCWLNGWIIRSTGSTGLATPPITLDVTIETSEIELLLVKVERHRYVFCSTGKNGSMWLPYVHQGVWEPTRGDLFLRLHESENRHERYAMAVYRSDAPGIVIGHLPKEISKMCYYFIRHDGKISGKVTGRRQHFLWIVIYTAKKHETCDE